MASGNIVAANFTATPLVSGNIGVTNVRGCVAQLQDAIGYAYEIREDCHVVDYIGLPAYTITQTSQDTNGFISDSECVSLVNNVIYNGHSAPGDTYNGIDFGLASQYGFNNCTPTATPSSSSSSPSGSSSSSTGSSSSAAHLAHLGLGALLALSVVTAVIGSL